MKYSIPILLAFITVACNQTEQQVEVIAEPETDTITETVEIIEPKEVIEYIDSADGFVWLNYRNDDDNLPQLEFEDITEDVFLKYYKAHTIGVDSSKVNWADSTYTIQTSKAIVTYTRIPKNYNYNRTVGTWHEYKGYLDKLNMYVLEGWSESEMVLGQLYALDSISNILYMLNTDTDGPADEAFVSPNADYLLYYGNSMIGSPPYCNFGVAKAYQKDGVTYYKNYKGVSLEELFIEGYTWMDDTTLLLKMYTDKYDRSTRNRVKTYSYLKTTL